MNDLRKTPPMLAMLLAAGMALADEHDHGQVAGTGVRTELHLGAHSWPSVGDLEPAAGGRFDDVGFSLGGSLHWPVGKQPDRRWLIGVDLGLFPTDSNIDFVSEDVVARGGYLTPSVKWQTKSGGPWTIDAGIGVYIVDIAEVVSAYGGFVETELWEQTTLGGYVGTTWNSAPNDAFDNNGLFVSLKIHFADFGNVRDENPLLPTTLGSDAGKLSGPVYQVLIGYRWQ